MVSEGRHEDGGAAPRTPLPPAGFTGRQVEVVTLLAAGLSAVEIGARLGISARTVRMHCDALRLKLAVARSRQIPVAFFQRTGLDPLLSVEPPDRTAGR